MLELHVRGAFLLAPLSNVDNLYRQSRYLLKYAKYFYAILIKAPLLDGARMAIVYL